MIKRKWKKCGVGEEKGETKLLLRGNVRKRGVGKGYRANTPHIQQLKTKTAPACCLVNPCPGQRPGEWAAPTSFSRTAQHPRNTQPAPDQPRGARQESKAAHV